MLDVLIKRPENHQAPVAMIEVSHLADRPIKSMLKSVSWRIVGTIDTMIISYFITGKVTVAVSIGSVEVLSKTVLYYFHERLWAHIHRIKLKLLNKPNGESFEFKRTEKSSA